MVVGDEFDFGTVGVLEIADVVVWSAGVGVAVGEQDASNFARRFEDEARRLAWSAAPAGRGAARHRCAGDHAHHSEYSTGAIRTSLTAVPRRRRFLSAKAVVIVAVTFVVAEITTVAAFVIGQAVISGHAPTANFGQPGVLRALIGCGLYGAVIGLLGLALGALLRHAAAAIAVLVALLFVLPGLAAALPSSVEHTAEKFWPTQAGQQVTQGVPTAHTLSPWAALAVMALFVIVVLTAAFFTFSRRDT